MWIRVCPNQWMNIDSKNGAKRSFSNETKASIHFSLCGEWICDDQSLREGRLLCESLVYLIEK